MKNALCKNLSYTIGVIVFFGLVVVGLVRMTPEDNRNNQNVVFLNSYGSINYFDDRENTISLAFITDYDLGDQQDVSSISFRSPYIEALEISVVEAASCSAYFLWYLSIRYQMHKNNSNDPVVLNSINFNGSEHDIGNITIYRAFDSGNENSHLKLKRNTAASVGRGLSDYFAEIENTSYETILIKSIDVAGYKGVSVLVEINGTLSSLPTELGAKVNGTFHVILTECETQEADVYYVSPVLVYSTGNETYQMRLSHFTCGLSPSKDELIDLGNRYFRR